MKLNDSIAHKLETFIKDYYQKFDTREPLEAFAHDFHWDDFLIASASVHVSTKEEYALFYKEIVASFVDSNHAVSNFIITHESDHQIKAACDVIFTAKQKTTLTPVAVSGRLKFCFVPSHDNASWQLSRYLIEA